MLFTDICLIFNNMFNYCGTYETLNDDESLSG